MNADAFRHIYEYHFAQNRKIWDAHITPLSPERFTQDVKYSHGSVRDQSFFNTSPPHRLMPRGL